MTADAAVRAWAVAHARSVAGAMPGSRHGQPQLPPSVWQASDAAIWSLACTTRASGQLLVATGDENGVVCVSDAATRGAVLHLATGYAGPTSSLAWLEPPDGRLLLAAGSLGGGARIWDVNDGAGLSILEGPADYVQSLAWTVTEDGQPLLATGGRDGSVRVWDGNTGDPLGALSSFPREVRSVAWATAPDGRLLLASTSRDHDVRVGDGRTGTELHRLAAHPRGANALAWAALPDGSRLLATGGDDGNVVVWDGLTGAEVSRLSCAPGWIASLAWVVSDSRLLLAAVSERHGELRLWDAKAGIALPERAKQGHAAQVASAVLPDGRAAVVTGGHDGRVRAWWLDQDTPEPVRRAAPAMVSGGAEIGVEEVSPAAWPKTGERATAVAWAVTADGQPLLATGTPDGVVLVWDGRTGERLHTLEGATGMIRSVAWAMPPDGRLLLAAVGADRAVRVWDVRAGQVVTYVEGITGELRAVAITVAQQGGVLLAAGGAQGVCVWEGLQPGPPRTFFTDSVVASVAWAALPTGRVLLAAGTERAGTQVADVSRPGPSFRLPGNELVRSVSAAVLDDGSVLFATAEGDKVRVWDGNGGVLLRTWTEPTGSVYSVAWAVLADGRPLLATAGRFDQRTTRILDGRTLTPMASLPGAQGTGGAVAWAQFPDGEVWLAATPGLTRRLARTWALSLAPETSSRAQTPAAHGLRPAEAGLLALGRAGLWPPLGLIADLVELTGPGEAATLNDGKLRTLSPHPGVQRLRALGWPVMARLSFAGLLANGVTFGHGYAAPSGAPVTALRDALAAALTGDLDEAGPGRAGSASLGELKQAADGITDRTAALLTIVGSAAAAADPALPLRLAQQGPRMPVLDANQLRLLRDTARPGVIARRDRHGGLRPAPGTADIGRRGNLRHLLPTQLALPTEVLVARYLQDQVLYRRHAARIPPVPDPVTLILDTTPPTYGAAENILRLVAHLITTVLWEHGENPVLISLSQPSVATELTGRAQLAGLWTTRSLNPPGPAIAAALGTIGDAPTSVVLLCHHFAPELHYLPGPDRRLLTTHHPVEPAPPPPSHPNHLHLPADPSQDQLIQAVWALLTSGGNGG